MEHCFSFEGLPGRTLRVWLFKDISNSRSVREQVVAGTLQPELALVDATLVQSLLVLRLAAQKALTAQSRGKLATRSLHAELVYNISGSKHIAESLKRFGISDDSKALLVARFDAQDGDQEKIKEVVNGTLCPIDELTELVDIAQMQKVYKVSQQELKVGTLTDAILCRISSRDC